MSLDAAVTLSVLALTLVAMGIPTLLGWSRRKGVPASKLLIPLSYASVLGGMCTLDRDLHERRDGRPAGGAGPGRHRVLRAGEDRRPP